MDWTVEAIRQRRRGAGIEILYLHPEAEDTLTASPHSAQRFPTRGEADEAARRLQRARSPRYLCLAIPVSLLP